MNGNCAIQQRQHCARRREAESRHSIYVFEHVAPLARRCLFVWAILAVASICCNSQGLGGKPKPKFQIVFDNRHPSEISRWRYQDVDIYIMGQDGSSVKRLTSDHRSHSPAWSPDGHQIAYLRDEPVNPPKESMSFKDHRFILETALQSFPAHSDLLLMSMNGEGSRKIASMGSDVRDLLWLPNAEWIALRFSNRLNLNVCVTHGEKNFDAKCDRMDKIEEIRKGYYSSGKEGRNPFLREYYPAADNFLPTLYMHWGNLGVLDEKEVESLGSTILVLPDLAASIGLKSLDEASAAAPVPAYDAAWSPDGKRIAYSVFSRSNHSILYIADLKDSHAEGERALTEPVLEAHSPAWSADSSRLAFTGLWKGTQQLFAMNADGKALIQVSMNQNQSCSHPSWSPDGGWIVAECRDNIIFNEPALYTDISGWDSSIYLFDMNRLSAAPRLLIECSAYVTDAHRCGAHNPSFEPREQAAGGAVPRP
jgi:dipeptidyl aminopeptidase/acylaminoacyl peptidase